MAMVATVLIFLSCGVAPRKAIFVGESDPADFTLSNTKPEVYAFEIPASATGPFDFAIEFTYFKDQMQGWDKLPLYYTIVYPDGQEKDKRFNLVLKDEKNEWRGQLKENETDRIFEDTIDKNLQLAPGKYQIKLFGDSNDLSKPILGVVHIAFKVYAY